jgi:hypothetical protein
LDRIWGQSAVTAPTGIARVCRGRCNAAMGTKSREVIWGGQIMGAEIHARHAREEAWEAAVRPIAPRLVHKKGPIAYSGDGMGPARELKTQNAGSKNSEAYETK